MKEVWLEVAVPVYRFSRPLAALVLRGRSSGAVALVLRDYPGHIVKE